MSSGDKSESPEATPEEEPAAPIGTWASDGSERSPDPDGAAADEASVDGGQRNPMLPGPTARALVEAGSLSIPEGTLSVRIQPSVDGPPAPAGDAQADAAPEQKRIVLASECLREDLEPTEPRPKALAYVGVPVALISGAGVLAAGTWVRDLWAVVLLVALAAVCGVRMTYAYRAGAAFALSVVGLGAITSVRVSRVAPGSALEAFGPSLLALGCVILVGGLLLRVVYRASRSSRWMVAIGVALVGGWFLWSGHLSGISTLDVAWQSWAPALGRVALLLLLLLSMLAFMEPGSTGGSQVWGTSLLIWYAAYTLLMVFAEAGPERLGVGVELAAGAAGHTRSALSQHSSFVQQGELIGLRLATIGFVTAGAIALAQTAVVMLGGGSARARAVPVPGH